MHVHEYQAKNLLKRYGISTPSFALATNVEELEQGIKELGIHEGIIKIQVHAGGRGKKGGVIIGHNPEELIRLGSELFGKTFINDQTGPLGKPIHKIIVSNLVSIHKEYYIAALIDRSMGSAILMVSEEGGMEIEKVAIENPKKILKLPIGLDGKMRSYHLLEAVKFLGWQGEVEKKGKEQLAAVAKCFIENDASLIEINPFVLTKEGQLMALDAKMTADDNALFRQPAIAQWYDSSQSTPNEVMAKQFNLSYIALTGTIGCLVNGAGLAMATMDLIKLYHGEPANFLDVGGSATKEEISQGFKIILLDEKVRSIFVNIFGGILDCGVLAAGIVEAWKEHHIELPLVVRLEGTNEEKGKEILKNSNLKISTVSSMEEGAKLAVKLADEG